MATGAGQRTVADMGGLPLLILDHSTPLDGRFIRRFSGFFWFTLGTEAIALVFTGFRRTIIRGLQTAGFVHASQCTAPR